MQDKRPTGHQLHNHNMVALKQHDAAKENTGKSEHRTPYYHRMSTVEQLHSEARMLLVEEHNALLSKQFLLECFLQKSSLHSAA